MQTNESLIRVATLNITASDARDAALTMLRNSATRGEIKANDKLAGSTLNAFLLGAIREGWKRDDVEAFRADAYADAEARGMPVNKASNSLLTATSRAAGFADRPDAGSIARDASTFSEALKIASNRDAAVELAARQVKEAEAARQREEVEQARRDEAALIVARSLDEDKASGRYQSDLLAKVRSLIDELNSLGVDCTLEVAE